MATVKECPLCGGTMQLHERKSMPSTPGAAVRTSREWVCPDCDHFEEAGEDD
jgi:YgiT-type zinc finger domain-containing protein